MEHPNSEEEFLVGDEVLDQITEDSGLKPRGNEPKVANSAFHRLWSRELLDCDPFADTIRSHANQRCDAVTKASIQVNEDNEFNSNTSFGDSVTNIHISPCNAGGKDGGGNIILERATRDAHGRTRENPFKIMQITCNSDVMSDKCVDLSSDDDEDVIDLDKLTMSGNRNNINEEASGRVDDNGNLKSEQMNETNKQGGKNKGGR